MKKRATKISMRMGRRGFTLVESLFVSLLFPMLILSAFAVVDSASTIFRTNSYFADLNHNAMQTLRTLSREVGQTSSLTSPSHLSITTDVSGNSVLMFQIPVDWDNDGDAYSGTLTPVTEWGAYDRPGQTRACQSSNASASCTTPQRFEIVGRWVRYSVSANQLVREVLSSGAVVNGTRMVVCNNVITQAGTPAFTVTRNQKRLSMSLTVSIRDTIGQKNAQLRTSTMTFTSQTILRNSESS